MTEMANNITETILGDIIIYGRRPRPRPLDRDERRAVAAALNDIIAAGADQDAYWDAHDRYNRLTHTFGPIAHEVLADVERGRLSPADAVARLTEATRPA